MDAPQLQRQCLDYLIDAHRAGNTSVDSRGLNLSLYNEFLTCISNSSGVTTPLNTSGTSFSTMMHPNLSNSQLKEELAKLQYDCF